MSDKKVYISVEGDNKSFYITANPLGKFLSFELGGSVVTLPITKKSYKKLRNMWSDKSILSKLFPERLPLPKENVKVELIHEIFSRKYP